MIRTMTTADIYKIVDNFTQQGWDGRKEILSQYMHEQVEQKRLVLVYEEYEDILGYLTIKFSIEAGPFKHRNIPEISDFNVFERFQGKGIGNQLLEMAESLIRKDFSEVALGVGLHSGYGAAQRLYCQRGYLPDGSGVWYNNRILAQNESCQNDDELVLYMSKVF